MNKQETDIGTCPAHWEVVKFSTVAELKHGYQFRTHDFTDTGIKVFKITQIKSDGSIDLSSCSFIDSSRLESFEKNIINNGDILMALSGATIGKIGRFKSDEVVLQNYRVGNFKPHDGDILLKDYFYYFLTTENTYYQILANQNQSAQENVGKEDIHNMLVFLPPLPEQKAIAEVLSSLDDKIDLLHRQNQTLEQMAETLFRQWFVEEADEDWEEKPLADILEFIVDNRGKTAPTSDFGLPLIATNCVKNSNLFPVYEKVRYISDDTYKNWFRAHPEPGDILFVNKGTPGCVNLVPDPVDFCIAQDMIALRVNNQILNNYFLFLYLRQESVQTDILNTSVGTTIPH